MRRFPDGFVWGTAASAYQIEGAVHADGRGTSVWDTFSHTPGRTRNGATGDVACDHYHRYPEDVALMRQLGVGAYRFSTAWPRVFPNGRGRPNQAGLAFYDRLVDALLGAGIDPWVCLHHWDMPQALEDAGGWRNRDTAYRFADYSQTVMQRLGDRVRHSAPINEPNVLPWVAYDMGVHAPGARSRAETLAAIHHINLAHGLCTQAIRAVDEDIRQGLIISLGPVHPADDGEEYERATEMVDCLWRRVMCDPIMLGRYPDILADDLAPFIQPGDMDLIGVKPDYFGMNHYNRMYAAPDPDRIFGAGDVPPPGDVPVTEMQWQIDPSAMVEQFEDLKHRYGELPPIYITENGAAFDDTVGPDGTVDDRDRVDYFSGYLNAVLDGIERGHDVRGYFVWSLMDNFEWAEGYEKKFGIVHVDFDNLERTPKASFRHLGRIIGENALAEFEPAPQHR